MANIKPLREGFDVVKGTKQEIKSTIRNMVDYAVKGNSKFVSELKRISWNSLPPNDVFSVIILIVSYGLKTRKEQFEKYVRQELMKGVTSVFQYMRDYNGVKVKERLNQGGFDTLFKSIFDDIDLDVDREKEWHELCLRLNMITKNNMDANDVAKLKSLQDSIINGENIDPVYDDINNYKESYL